MKPITECRGQESKFNWIGCWLKLLQNWNLYKTETYTKLKPIQNWNPYKTLKDLYKNENWDLCKAMLSHRNSKEKRFAPFDYNNWSMKLPCLLVCLFWEDYLVLFKFINLQHNGCRSLSQIKREFRWLPCFWYRNLKPFDELLFRGLQQWITD